MVKIGDIVAFFNNFFADLKENLVNILTLVFL
jgi:hypothetical protein